jgi:uncharacterized protein YndB with AHSA1/START domain
MIDGDEVVHEIDLPVPPSAVFRMFVDPAQLVRWIGLSADVDPRPGGRFRWEVAPGEFCEGEYVAVEPHTRIVVTWGWSDPNFGLPPGSSRVEITLTPTGDGTRLRLIHRLLPPELRLLHDDGWRRFMARLSAAVTRTDPGPYPSERPDERLRSLRQGEQL